ncbi:MAG: 2-isopropylmalate synthase [Lachnospiraceae bacterium]|nr:2-isopropylmalate synthase [Lachnospiraceae bacterium]
MKHFERYRRNPVPEMTDRKWPYRTIDRAPLFCSVDLRDGNQALMEPMTVDEKTEFFTFLCGLGFRDIEVGFPAASSVEYEFVRRLAEEKLVPADCRIQLLMQCNEDQIRTAFEAARGLSCVIMHIYNPTSVLQRDVVFAKSREETKAIAVRAAEAVLKCAGDFPGEVIFEYSPESFSGTEPEYAVEVIEAVLDVWKPTKEHKAIINLPETVELNTPNVYADMVEYVSTHLKNRDAVTLSIHTHNDRGTGVAATELGILAGADRVEGTLFGNGERTGNADLLTIALNLFAEGVDPGLELSDIPGITEEYRRLVKMPVHPRHPYAGELAFTAFSGGHQDAISKGFAGMKTPDGLWRVPYLLIDPRDIGRTYEPLVRINSQSGKGGVAFVMERTHGFRLPKEMHREFAGSVQAYAEQKGGEVTPEELLEVFRKEYLQRKSPLRFIRCNVNDRTDVAEKEDTHAVLTLSYRDEEMTLDCYGNGPIDAVKKGLQKLVGRNFRLLDYTEHALTTGSEAQAAAYVSMEDTGSGATTFGVGISSNITRASIRAVFCALNRLLAPDAK